MSTRYAIILLLGALTLGMTGCEFLRSVAGRPSAEQIASKADSIAAADAAQAAREAALAAARAYSADSLAAVNALAGVQKITFSEVRRLFAVTPGKRYAIMAGSFGEASNASALVKKISAAGCQAETMAHRNGHQAVAVSPTDDIVELYKAYKTLSGQNYLPADAWILVNE